MFRVARELVRNSAHHAEASTVRIALDVPDARGTWAVALEVADDGIGLDPDAVGEPPEGHLGTRLVTDLAAAAGARPAGPLRGGPGHDVADGGAGMTIGSPPAALIRVVIVDDHPLIRTGLTALLDGLADIDVVGEAANGEQAVEVVAARRPDVVLMDLSMPGTDGVAATRRRAGRAPGRPGAGADLVLRPRPHRRRARRGRHRLPAQGQPAHRRRGRDPRGRPPRVAAGPAGGQDPARRPGAGPVRACSAPGRPTCCGWSARGMANKQIARALGIRESTVKVHLGNVFRRIGVQDRTSAALWAQANLPPQ